MRRFVKHNLALIILIVMAVLFLPTVVSKDAESESDAIVTAIGVDRQQNNYQLSLQVLVPTPASQYNQKLSVVTDKGEDISTTISKIQLRLGKEIGLSHCKVFVFSSDVAKEGLTQVFDYIFRAKSNTQNIVLIHTPDSAKDFLTNSSDLENNLYFSIRNRGSFNENYLIGDQTTLGSYYTDYLGPVKTSLIATVELLDEKQASGDSSSSGGGGTSSSGASSSGSGDTSSNESASGGDSANESATQGGSSGGQQKKVIVNRGKLLVVKDGKTALELTPQQSQMINWFNDKAQTGTMVIQNVTQQGLFDNANVGVQIDQKKSTITTTFDKGMPTLTLSVKLYVRTVEINQTDYTGNSYKSNSVNVTEHLKQLIKQKVTTQAESAFELCKDNKVDLIKVYETFNKYNNKKFKQYLNGLDNKQDYLNQIALKVKVEVEEYL